MLHNIITFVLIITLIKYNAQSPRTTEETSITQQSFIDQNRLCSPFELSNVAFTKTHFSFPLHFHFLKNATRFFSRLSLDFEGPFSYFFNLSGH